MRPILWIISGATFVAALIAADAGQFWLVAVLWLVFALTMAAGGPSTERAQTRARARARGDRW